MSGSSSGSMTTEFRHVDEPAISLTGPGDTTPAPSAQAWLSAPPSTTGTAAERPNRRTSAGLSSPRTWADARTGGSSAWSRFNAESISALQPRALKSNSSVAAA